MKKEIVALKEKAFKLITDSRALAEKANKEGRAMSAEETVSYDKMFADATELKSQAERMEKSMELETGLRMEAGRQIEEPKGEVRKDTEKEVRAFMKYLIHNDSTELRAMSAGTVGEGGYLVPEVLANKIITGINNMMFMKNICSVDKVVGATSLGIPYVSADASDAEWTAEIVAATADDTLALLKRSLTPHQLCKLIKVSQKLIQLSPKAEQLVIDRISYKMAAAQENGFLNGTGTTMPIGVFYASASGINTDRDVATDNAATAFSADGLINAMYSVAGQYRKAGSWVMHRDAVKMASKLKDGEGRYLWSPSLAAGKPDTLLGSNLYESEYAPNTFTTGLYVGVFGDFKQYQIVESLEMSIQRLNELYAATNQVGFIPRVHVDGQPVLPAAFARVKLG